MVLSNAERQRRYREKLKAAAHGADLPARVRAALDAAFAVVWDVWTRENLGDAEGHTDWESVRATFSGDLADMREIFSNLDEEANPDEAAILRRALAVIDAVAFAEGKPKKGKGRRCG